MVSFLDGYLVGKELVILLFVCVVGKMFCGVLCIFRPMFPSVLGLYLIASIPGHSFLTSRVKEAQMYTPEPKIRKKMKASATIDAVT